MKLKKLLKLITSETNIEIFKRTAPPQNEFFMGDEYFYEMLYRTNYSTYGELISCVNNYGDYNIIFVKTEKKGDYYLHILIEKV